ncbi:MAG: hypothetical protein PEGG_00730 [Paraeggerthella hongkongensis]
MGSSIDAFNIIASDIGVKRFVGENEDSFCRRTVYSAARFWLSAFCMDDGANGEKGLTKQAMNRKLKRWITSLDKILPGIDDWFNADGKGLLAVYNRLIDIGDLALNGFEDSYVATPPAVKELSESLSCISGYFDPTAARINACDRDVDSLTLSGMLSLVRSKNNPVQRPVSWWIEDLKYADWEIVSAFDEVKFADNHASCWNINRSDVWGGGPLWVNNLALAKVDGNGIDPMIFVATRIRGRARLHRITWIQAQELFFYLRRESGNQAVSRYVMLDKLHMQAALPIGFLPGHVNRILDAIGWPVENAEDRFSRIIRAEALPLVEELLSAGCIGFERASNDR